MDAINPSNTTNITNTTQNISQTIGGSLRCAVITNGTPIANGSSSYYCTGINSDSHVILIGGYANWFYYSDDLIYGKSVTHENVVFYHSGNRIKVTNNSHYDNFNFNAAFLAVLLYIL